jgi:hypothetical protein
MKSLTKPTAFGVPSTGVLDRIDSSDKVSALHAAGYRYEARLSELEQQFEAKASELRETYLGEVSEIHQGEAA